MKFYMVILIFDADPRPHKYMCEWYLNCIFFHYTTILMYRVSYLINLQLLEVVNSVVIRSKFILQL